MAGYHWTSACFYHRYMMLAKRKTPEDLSLFLSKCLIFTFTRLKKWIVLTTHFHEQLYFWKQTRRQFKLITLRFSVFFFSNFFLVERTFKKRGSFFKDWLPDTNEFPSRSTASNERCDWTHSNDPIHISDILKGHFLFFFEHTVA